MLAFIHIAKTGGQTVQTMLSSAHGPRHCEAVLWKRPVKEVGAGQRFVIAKYDVDDYRRLLRICPRPLSISGHPVTLWGGLQEVASAVRFFCFVRDPLARGASHYQYQCHTETPDLAWDDWVAWDVHHNHQVKMLARSGTAAEAIANIERLGVFVGLTERFDESLVMLRRFLAPGLNIAYRRVNMARSNDLAQAVLADQGARLDMERIYAEDLKLHAYIRNKLFPAYQRRYGIGLAADVTAFQAKKEKRFNWFNFYSHKVVRRFYVQPAAALLQRWSV